MPALKNIKELRSLQGHLAYIRRFISNLARRCQPLSHLMKKDAPFIWDHACQNDFESIKTYLLNSPVLGAPISEKPLILYIAAQEESLGAMLVQNDEENKERALYYLSRRLTKNELMYSPIEKMCLALVFSSQKLRHYFQAHTIHLVAKADPKALKGQALANFLADHPISADWEISEEFPDEDVLFIEVLQPWTMFYDGAARLEGAGAGVIFVSPQKQVLPYAFILREKCSNNVAEYQALILGLQMATEMKILDLEIFGDSKLIINLLCGDYEVKKDDLVPYFQYASHLLKNLEGVTHEHVPREENRMADALANLATTLALQEGENVNVHVCKQWILPQLLDYRLEEANAITVMPIKDNDWRQPLIDYLQHGKLPNDRRHRAEIRRRAPRFIFFKDTLFRRSFEGVFLRCLRKEESQQAMEESHSGICGAHQSGPKLHFRGLDAVGPLTKSSAGHLYILAATDYFSKWAEAILAKEVKKETVVDFIKSNIIFRYGVPRHIIIDNGTPFINKLMDKLCDKFDFMQRTSSMNNAPANGLADAFNKTLSNLLKKVVAKSRPDWTPTQATPYSLVYGVEAVLPLERRIPSLRIALQEGLTDEENAKLYLAEFEALDEKRLEAQQQLECYQARISKAFDKKVKPRSFKFEDLVLPLRRPIITNRRTHNKFLSKWDGPYVAVEV
ncbi:uncharacterized protein LOC131317464 [Rhododendron vialii]|uniref:uncharacterized protein LOC131317464 n=1 Tax=Rhododendron vialii TaxID=182163 RepID=UPI00265DFE87|nr:uncharacterized protein LOC131317464 [Rhododendron vialii]